MMGVVSAAQFSQDVHNRTVQNAAKRVSSLIECLRQQLLLGHFLGRCGQDLATMKLDTAGFLRDYKATLQKEFPTHFATTIEQQKKALRQFLFNLWTRDVQKKVLTPKNPHNWRPSIADWGFFWVKEHELDALVHSVIKAYNDELC